MKILKDILYGVRISEIIGNTNTAIEHICFDSREVKAYSLFTAINGVQVDGHDYIEKALELGAVCIICEQLPIANKPGVSYIKVEDSSAALGQIAANFYDNPSEELKLVGVTGTNGKTTVCTLLHSLSLSLGYNAGLISTVENKIGNEVIPATHTTPDAIQLNALLRDMVTAGCEIAFMEVSSHAVHQNRINGVQFSVAGFTNITHDHLDYHKTFDHYLSCKKKFFDDLKPGAFAVVNLDDPHGETMVHDTRAKIYTYGLFSASDFRAKILENQFSGLILDIQGSEVYTQLIGGFNAYNLLLVFSIADLLGLDKMEILTAISQLKSVDGRFEFIKSDNNITGIVDYAHTPDALENVLKTIENIRTNNEQVITVIGCGGDRDKAKRPIMAQVACKLSDQVILTSDNPRSEDPELIIKEMEAGLDPVDKRKTLSITNRAEAIKTAVKIARDNDIILVAGKGHEKYQIIGDQTLAFDDMQTLIENLKTLQQ